MNDDSILISLRNKCRRVFSSASNEYPKKLLKNVLEVVKENYEILQNVADKDFMEYIMRMNVNEYIIATNGDDFELRLKGYIQQENLSLEKIWHILSQLVWDLTVPVTEKICPFCRCDNIIILTDKEKKHIYESCENCFCFWENGIQIARIDDVFPANSEMIRKHGYICLDANKSID